MLAPQFLAQSAVLSGIDRPSRRGFLVASATVGTGMLLGFHVPTRAKAAESNAAGDVINPINAYIRIGTDSSVTVLSAHMDGGQGIYTGVATLVAEELEADWAQMRVEGASGNPKLYGNVTWGGTVQGTGGSSATPSSWERYRRAGATARAMLAEAAARSWGVDVADVTVENGIIRHPDGMQATFGEMAPMAALVQPPADVTLKAPANWKYIGNEKLRRVDTVAKTTGRHPFPIDIQLPGMLTAVLARPPRFGAKARSFDATAAKQMKGVVDVVATPRGIAVVAENTWAALQGRDRLTVDWDESGAEMRGTDQLMAEYRQLGAKPDAPVARREGDAAGALAGAARVIEADFEFPYLAHAAMEPLDAVAQFKDGELEIWAGHQLPDLYQGIAAEMMGIEPARVRLHVMTPGGFFGRRAVPDGDVIVEVVSVLKATGAKAPIRVLWTREDDTRGGRYRPMYFHRVRAGLDEAGNIVAWQHRIVGQSILAGTPFEAMLVKDSVDGTSVEGASNLPYAIPKSAG